MVVQSIELKKFINLSTPVRKCGLPRLLQYVVATGSWALSITGLIVGIAAVLAFIGVFLSYRYSSAVKRT